MSVLGYAKPKISYILLLRQLETVIRRPFFLSNATHPSIVRWLPIMQAYEAGNPMYFATPPVNLIYAFNASLKTMTKSSPSLEERFELHKKTAGRVRSALGDLGLKLVRLPAGLS